LQLLPHELCSLADTAIKNTLIAGFGTEKDDSRAVSGTHQSIT